MKRTIVSIFKNHSGTTLHMSKGNLKISLDDNAQTLSSGNRFPFKLLIKGYLRLLKLRISGEQI